MTAIPVSYGAADLVKVTVTFAYDRYVIKPTTKPAGTAAGVTEEPLSPETPAKAAPKPQRSLTPTERRQGIDRRGTDIRGGNFRTP